MQAKRGERSEREDERPAAPRPKPALISSPLVPALDKTIVPTLDRIERKKSPVVLALVLLAVAAVSAVVVAKLAWRPSEPAVVLPVHVEEVQPTPQPAKVVEEKPAPDPEPEPEPEPEPTLAPAPVSSEEKKPKPLKKDLAKPAKKKPLRKDDMVPW